MIYAIVQTVAFASLAGVVSTSSVTPALPLLPKPQKNSFIKSLLDKASTATTLNEKDIDDEEDINALTFSARTVAGTKGAEDYIPYYLEIGSYSDSSCNVKESAQGYRLNDCVYDDEKDRSYLFQVFGKKNNKILLSIWYGDGCSGRADMKVNFLDYFTDSSGKSARLGRCQADNDSSFYEKLQVLDDYPSRKASTNGQSGIFITYFQEPAECNRNDYSNFYEYEYSKIYSSPCENVDDDQSFYFMCSRNHFKWLYFDEVDCNGVNTFNNTMRRNKCSLVTDGGDEDSEDDNLAARRVFSTYCV